MGGARQGQHRIVLMHQISCGAQPACPAYMMMYTLTQGRHLFTLLVMQPGKGGRHVEWEVWLGVLPHGGCQGGPAAPRGCSGHV